VEALADAVRLRRFRLGPGVIDVVDRQVQLIIVLLRPAAVFRTAIGQNPQQRQLVLLDQRQDPIVQEIRCRDRRFRRVQLGTGHLGVGVDEGLLVDPADAFQRADVVGVLRAKIAGMMGLDFAAGLAVLLALLQGRNLGLGINQPSAAALASRAFRRFLKVSRSCLSQAPRTPVGETKMPRFLSSLLART
jgi:hypothetical protein